MVKTTVDLPDDLMREAKEFAAREGIPLRQVFETGVRLAIEKKGRPGRRFRLKTITVKGRGLQMPGDWETIRETIYRSRGG